MPLKRKPPALFYGWWVLGSSAIIMLYTSGVVNFGFTAVFEPIAQEFGWSYTQISLGASLRGLETGLMAPFVGVLVDRWGSRRLVFLGSIIMALGLFVLSRVSSLGMFYGAFVLISAGLSVCVGTVFVPVVGNWFRRKSSTAFGILTAGVGLAGLLVPVVTMLVDTFQWRTAVLILSLSVLAVNLPLSLLVRHRPEPYGYLPDGDLVSVVKTGEHPVSAQSEEVNFTARQALKARAFWHLALAGVCYSFVSSAMATHIMPYLSSVAISRSFSSSIALILPLVSILGRLGAGWLGDRLDRKLVYGVSFALMTIGLIFFAYVTAGTLLLLVPFIIAYSLGWGGTMVSRASLLRQCFGRKNFGAIFGLADGIMTVGHTAGIPLVGWVYDTWGIYQGAWLGSAALTFVGMLLVMTSPALNTIRVPETTPAIVNPK